MKGINNKGFTLIELIGIVVILVAIFLVSFPILSGIMKEDEDVLYEDMVNDLCLAGKTYIYSNVDEFPELSTPDSTINIPIITLINYGSVSKNKENPKTGELIQNHKLIFTVQEDNNLKCKYSASSS